MGWPAPQPPPPLPRPATENERATAIASARQIQAGIAEITRRQGRPPVALEEALGELPDNPVVPGRGAVAVSCPPERATEQADWAWCPETGAVSPLGLQ